MGTALSFAHRPLRPHVATPSRDRRTPLIGGSIVLALVGLSILQERLAHPMRYRGYAFDPLVSSSHHLLFHSLGLLANMIVGLIALIALARALDRRGCPTVVHLVATLGLAIALSTLGLIIIDRAVGHATPLTRWLSLGPLKGVQIFGLWVLAFRYPKLVNDSRVRALEAERLSQAAELSRLREHLQPHFLRNTLNTIAASVRDDPDQARNLLAALGDLLTDSLESDEPLHTLGEETAWLRRYSEIVLARHLGALRFSWDLDPAANAVELPRLLLQPLVENAVRHGALARDGGGEVAVTTRRTDRGVVVTISDDGPGIDPTRPEGLGLHLVRRRLAIECDGSRLRLESSPAGTRAIVELS